MAFEFERRESVAKTVRRLGCKRVKKALDALQHCEQAEAVHSIRKDIKQLRGLLTLVRPRIKKAADCSLEKLSRKAAHQLGPIRDAYVHLNALRNLTLHFKRQVVPGTFRELRTMLRSALEEETKRFENESKPRKVEQFLHRLPKHLRGLTVCGKGWKAISPGLQQSYSRGLCAFKAARQDTSPENLHEWRKRAKDLWYQIRLLRPIWPEQMDAAAHELKELTEALGDDHDLVMLQEIAGEQEPTGRNAAALEILSGLIKQRQDELRCAALALGARFYAEKPSAFCGRLQRYWQVWRGETPVSKLESAT